MVLVFAESEGGKFKKAAFETVSYGKAVADALGTECAALVVGTENNEAGSLGKYGADKVYQIAQEKLNHFDSQTFTRAIAGTAEKLGAKVIIVSHSSTGKSLIGRLAVKLNAGSVAGVNSVPTNDGSFKVKKSVYSGKAIATYEINTDYKVLSLMGNAFRPNESGSEVSVENLDIETGDAKVKVLEHKTVTGTVPLPEAELVVSAGRGMKGPENWGMIEELANELGATTACSRPVADAGWRPHHEHVGQTGIAIRPNLYIAIGISGAIQHLAGVNNSKTIVVINKDPEAPFFKAADYGVVGDAFDVVPRLIESVKKFKG
ncbi:MAG: electron transfer flavoprotein subunit alpha/FixB family protein [Saprospiraceae bacterium]